jgi:hypothetical protein
LRLPNARGETFTYVSVSIEALASVLISPSFFDCPHKPLLTKEIQAGVRNFSDVPGKPTMGLHLLRSMIDLSQHGRKKTVKKSQGNRGKKKRNEEQWHLLKENGER